MKDSGIPWVGEIPADWEIGKVKGCLRRHEVKGHGDAEVLALYRDYGVVPKDSRDDNHNRTGRDTNDYKYVRKGDLVINKMKAWQGSLSVSEYEGIVSPAYFIYEFVGQGLRRGFADYLLRSTYKQEFERVSGGIREGQWDLPRYDFEHMQLPLPGIEEQQRITDYLDEHCAAIDEVRKTITDEIEALRRLRSTTIHRAVTKGLDVGAPTRDSGVDWMGDVPSHWETRKLKYLFEIVKRIAGKEGFDVLAITQQGIRVKDITNSEGQQLAKDYSGYQFVYPGDYAMNHMDLITGWVDCSALFGVTSPDYRVFRPMKNRQINRDYFRYVFQNCYSNRIFNNLGNGVSGQGRWRLQTPAFNNFVVPLPPLSEQQQIANYLDERCAAIDPVIDTRTKQLKRLEDYRRALIFAYVTGKKEVPSHE